MLHFSAAARKPFYTYETYNGNSFQAWEETRNDLVLNFFKNVDNRGKRTRAVLGRKFIKHYAYLYEFLWVSYRWKDDTNEAVFVIS